MFLSSVGVVTDKYGRKPVLVAVTVASFLIVVLLWNVPKIGMYFVAQALTGCLNVMDTPILTMIADVGRAYVMAGGGYQEKKDKVTPAVEEAVTTFTKPYFTSILISHIG